MKRIDEIDPNFKVNASIPADMAFHDPRNAPFSIHGLTPNDQGSYNRLPLDLLPLCNEGEANLSWSLAGGVVRFSTDSTRLAVLWTLRDVTNMPHFPATGQSGLELYEETDHGHRQVKTIIPQMDEGRGCKRNQAFVCPLPGGMRHYCLYLPLYNGLNELLIGLDEGANVARGRMPRIEKPLLFYGSSITQGGCASKPGSCYCAILARRLDANMINMGFSGSSRGGEYMANFIARTPMSAFIMDYDHNAPDAAHLQATHQRFFDIVRTAQPELPIIMASMPDFDRDPVTNAARRTIIANTWVNVINRGDKNAWFVDGQQFFGSSDRELCTVDGCHPTDLGFVRMADTFEPVLRAALDCAAAAK